MTGEGPPALRRDLVVVGASAGGIDVLRQMVRAFPADLGAAVLVVLHLSPESPSALPEILQRACRLPIAPAVDGHPIRAGEVLVAPPDRHMLVMDGRARLTRGPKENSHRPAIDALFRTAAADYGPRVVGVVLSGMLDDGSAGLAAIKAAGGLAVVQDPADALYPSMPQNALRSVEADEIWPAARLGAGLAGLVGVTGAANPGRTANPGHADHPPKARTPEAGDVQDPAAAGATGYVCPDCGGALWEEPGSVLRYRCRVGHAYNAETLYSRGGETLEDALWVGLRALQERASLARRVADHNSERGHERIASHFRRSAEDAERRSSIIRHALEAADGAGDALEPAGGGAGP